MSLVSSADLAYMRACQAEVFPDTCTLQRVTEVNNDRGNITQDWTLLDQTGIVCRIFWGLRNREAAGTQGDDITRDLEIFPSQWMASFPHDTDVIIKDRILSDGKIFQVTSTNTEKSWLTAIRCNLDRLDP